jgi:SAM-dependent methyltransferase
MHWRFSIPRLVNSFFLIHLKCRFSSFHRAISLSPDYPAVLQRLKSGDENFLDLGCCFGQGLRKVAADGAVQGNLYGSDLRAEFFEMGYRLFRDRDALKSKFIVADITDPSSPLSELDGKIDIIYAGSFLHLFSYAELIEVCKRLVKLLREKKDSLILGRQVGNADAGDYVQKINKGGKMYRHNAESFKKMWEEIGEATGTKWRVDCEFTLFESLSEEERKKNAPGMGLIRFSVFRE